MNRTDDDGAFGLLVGLAIGDGWGGATEIALCVADAAATGLPLDDPRSVDLLRRNLRSRVSGPSSEVGVESDDAVLAAAAVVAIAHRRDTAEERDGALTAVLATLEVPVSSRPGVSEWVEALVEAITTGRFDGEALLRPVAWSTALQEVAATLQAEGDGTAAGARARAALSADSAARRTVPAAVGALVGATLGYGALPLERIARLAGWPGADADVLLTVAVDVAAPRERGAPGVTVGAGTRPPVTDRTTPVSVAPENGWRVTRVRLRPIESGGAA